MILYHGSGYVNIDYVLSFNMPITIVVGGRGTGKTYGALKHAIEFERHIILMRRTQSQADLINKPEFSPINPVVYDMGLECQVKTISKYNSSITVGPDTEQLRLLGFTAALSTFSNLRGFDASGVDLIVYDEFIPEVHERPLKEEGAALLNVYETVNRNRELQGRKPLQMLLLSNANRLDSPVLAELDLINVVDRMNKKGQEEWINPQRGIALFVLQHSPISEKKADTAIYKVSQNSKFSRMSLGNEFAFDDLTDVRSINLAGWKLKAQLGPWYIYKKDRLWYISAHGAGTPSRIYADTEIDKRRFIFENPSCRDRILQHKVLYENYQAKRYLTDLYI